MAAEIAIMFFLITNPDGALIDEATRPFQGPADLDLSECLVDVDEGCAYFLCHVPANAELTTTYTVTQYLAYDLGAETSATWEPAPGSLYVGGVTVQRKHWAVYLSSS